MRPVVACFLAGLSLAVLAGPASAQPVTYWAELVYQKLTQGPSPPPKVVVVEVRARSAQAAEAMCGGFTNMLRLSRNLQDQNARKFGMTGKWYAGGGSCLIENGKIKMRVEAGGSN